MDTVAGCSVGNRKAVSAPALPDGSVTVAVPLLSPDRVAGVFELRMPPGSVLKGERLARLARFAQFTAVALERDAERVAVKRAMTGYVQLNTLASSLGAQTDIAGVGEILARKMTSAFDFAVAGVVLHSWGADRADLAVRGELGPGDVAHALALATGRDPDAAPIEQMRTVSDESKPASDAAEREWSLSAVPIGYGEIDVGWMFVARRDSKSYSAQDRALLEAFAAHGGPAFARAALFARIRDDYARTMETLLSAFGMRERAHAARAGNVMEYAVRIGEKLELGVEAVERLRFAGLLHDTGKAGIPCEITLRPTTLTPQELLEAHSRTDTSPSIVDQIDFLESLMPVIVHHHENWDGSGYPHGLIGERIPQLARVLRVAEAFAELTSPGVATTFTAQEACAYLQTAAGTLYDPGVVKALSEVIGDQEVAGSTGLLSADVVSYSGPGGIEESLHRC
jgi:HD-GYP domain-containing protein (c-di-GMP phosphodiesterase class II)